MADALDDPGAGAAAVRGGVLRFVGFGAGSVLTVASAALVFRELGVEQGGRYVLVMTIVTVAAGVTDAGLSAVSLREISNAAAGAARSRLVGDLLGLRLVVTGLGIAVACGYAALIGLPGTLVLGTLLSGLGMLFLQVEHALGAILAADLRLGWVTAVEVGRQALLAAGLGALALAGASLGTFFVVAPIAGAVSLVAIAIVVRRLAGPVRVRLSWPAMRALLAKSLPFALASTLALVTIRVGMLVLEADGDAEQVGLYGVSLRVVEVLAGVPILVVTAALPIFSRAARDDAARLGYAVQRVLEACVVLGAGLALLLAVGAPVVVDVIAGSKFSGSDDVLRLHGLVLAGSFPAAVMSFALLSLHRNRAVLAAHVAALAVALGGALLLVPSEGAQGAALAAVASELTLLAVGWVLVRREPQVRPTGWVIPKVAVAAGVAVLPALVLPALPAAVLAGLVFGVLALALRAVPPELLEALRRRT